jgi:hypothetical protein
MPEPFEGALTSVLHDNVANANMTKIPINDTLRLITPAPIFLLELSNPQELNGERRLVSTS